MKRWLNKLRCVLIETLAGSMPVMLNMTVSRPNGFKGPLVYLPAVSWPGIVHKNRLLSEEREALIQPTKCETG